MDEALLIKKLEQNYAVTDEDKAKILFLSSDYKFEVDMNIAKKQLPDKASKDRINSRLNMLGKSAVSLGVIAEDVLMSVLRLALKK